MVQGGTEGCRMPQVLGSSREGSADPCSLRSSPRSTYREEALIAKAVMDAHDLSPSFLLVFQSTATQFQTHAGDLRHQRFPTSSYVRIRKVGMHVQACHSRVFCVSLQSMEHRCWLPSALRMGVECACERYSRQDIRSLSQQNFPSCPRIVDQHGRFRR